MVRRGVTIAVLLAVAVLAVWTWGGDGAAPPREAMQAARDAAAPAGAAPAQPPGTRVAADAAVPAAAGAGAATAGGPSLRVRLVGCRREAPWTAALRLRVEGRDAAGGDLPTVHDERTPDADGRVTFALPAWCASAPHRRLVLSALDAHYQPLDVRGPVPDLTAEFLVDVQVVATLTGRVVDTTRAPVAAARLVAFAWRDGDAVEPALAHANTRRDGTFTLRVPPDTALLLVAAPMQPLGPRSKAGPPDGSEPDCGLLRHDLLPASRRVVGTIGPEQVLDDVVLPGALQLSGVVRWSDGAAVPGATVRTLPRPGRSLPLSDRSFLSPTAAGLLVPGAETTTGDDGTFVLPAVAGEAIEVGIVGLAAPRLIGSFLQPAVAPQRVDFVLPRAITLRAMANGRAVPGAAVECALTQRLTTDEHGGVAVVTALPLRVRALHERLRSPWCDVPVEAAGSTVDLAMDDRRVELTLEFEGEFRVRNTVVTWRRDDGNEGREHLLRDDRAGPFRLFLEPGRYRLTAGPGGGERNGVFLLPVTRDVALDDDTVAVQLPAVFGGSFTVMATDGSGVWLAGHCQLLARDGSDVTDRFEVREATTPRSGTPGELLADGVNHFLRVLPPGDYELLADFGARGAVRQLVAIRPREITEVRLRLP